MEAAMSICISNAESSWFCQPRTLVSALRMLGFVLLSAALSGAFAAKPVARDDRNSKGPDAVGQTRVGLASYYGPGLQGKETAAGETFDKNDISAAHPTYPMGTRLKVTNLRNGRAINVRINDRGPVRKHRAQGVIIDLSERAARELGFRRDGRTRVKTEVLELGEQAPRTASAEPVVASATREPR
jgi:rare lipoprotein A